MMERRMNGMGGASWWGATCPSCPYTMRRCSLKQKIRQTQTWVCRESKPFSRMVLRQPRNSSMNVRGPALTVIWEIISLNEALAWRALIIRYAPNLKSRIQSLMNEIINVRTFSSELTEFEIAMDEWQKNIRKWGTISGDLFNELMKKIIFLEKAPLSVRISRQIHSPDTFESMTAVKGSDRCNSLPREQKKVRQLRDPCLDKTRQEPQRRTEEEKSRDKNRVVPNVNVLITWSCSEDVNKVNTTNNWSKHKRKSGPYNKDKDKDNEPKEPKDSHESDDKHKNHWKVNQRITYLIICRQYFNRVNLNIYNLYIFFKSIHIDDQNIEL